MGTSPIPTEMLRTPPLGGTMCPDPRWNGGRALTLHGPTAFLGPRWVLTASAVGQPAAPTVPPVEPPEYVVPPGTIEGSIPFVDEEA